MWPPAPSPTRSDTAKVVGYESAAAPIQIENTPTGVVTYLGAVGGGQRHVRVRVLGQGEVLHDGDGGVRGECAAQRGHGLDLEAAHEVTGARAVHQQLADQAPVARLARRLHHTDPVS